MRRRSRWISIWRRPLADWARLQLSAKRPSPKRSPRAEADAGDVGVSLFWMDASKRLPSLRRQLPPPPRRHFWPGCDRGLQRLGCGRDDVDQLAVDSAASATAPTVLPVGGERQDDVLVALPRSGKSIGKGERMSASVERPARCACVSLTSLWKRRAARARARLKLARAFPPTEFPCPWQRSCNEEIKDRFTMKNCDSWHPSSPATYPHRVVS
jgi:hypothetical protein